MSFYRMKQGSTSPQVWHLFLDMFNKDLRSWRLKKETRCPFDNLAAFCSVYLFLSHYTHPVPVVKRLFLTYEQGARLRSTHCMYLRMY